MKYIAKQWGTHNTSTNLYFPCLTMHICMHLISDCDRDFHRYPLPSSLTFIPFLYFLLSTLHLSLPTTSCIWFFVILFRLFFVLTWITYLRVQTFTFTASSRSALSLLILLLCFLFLLLFLFKLYWVIKNANGSKHGIPFYVLCRGLRIFFEFLMLYTLT